MLLFSWQTWQIESHFLEESIFANSSTDIQRWKRKKAILLSSFLSRKIKLLTPTIDSLTEELLSYIRKQMITNKNKECIWQTTIDKMVFPWLVYSLSALILDIDLPKYHQFVGQSANALSSRLIESCRRFVQANNRIQESPLLYIAPSLGKLVNLHIMSANNRKQIQSVLNDAIIYRLENGLLGLIECGSKRPSKKSVKFRDEVYSSLIAEGKTDVNNGNDNDCVGQRPSSPRPQIKELTMIDIILNYEREPEDKLEGNFFGSCPTNKLLTSSRLIIIIIRIRPKSTRSVRQPDCLLHGELIHYEQNYILRIVLPGLVSKRAEQSATGSD